MIKRLKYALMAFSLIAGMKLVQVLFIYQAPKKSKGPFQKVAKAEAEMTAKRNLLVDLTPKEIVEDEIPKAIEDIAETNSTDTASKIKTPTEYPTLDDLKENYISIKNAALEEGRSREDVVIRYYKHEKDGDKVYALKDLKYYLHEKPATETKGLGSNVIYYGDEVNKEDIQVVAFILLENGIPLKSIERSKYDWKSNSIEIGTDSLLIEQNNLTKKDIRDL
ncbi:MAG: hypothetical protein AB8B73_04515 [Ekhidna sp.]